MVTRNMILSGAWRVGNILSGLKEDIGHGKWIIWLISHFPELGSTDRMREENAARCMKLYKENECIKDGNSRLLSIDSVRKFMWGYIPAKDRPQLEGDSDIDPSPHHLTFVNQFSKWDRQRRSGHV